MNSPYEFRMRSLKCVFAALVFGGLVLLTVAPISAQTLILATDDTPGDPYVTGGGKNLDPAFPGIEIELYRMAARDLGLTVTISRLPWKRCLKEIESGRLDGIFPASYRPEREALGIYPMKDGQPDPDRRTRGGAYYLYRRSDSQIFWNGTAFEDPGGAPRIDIGVPLGWAIGGDLKKKGIRVVEKTYPRDLLHMLAAGGLAGVVCLDTVVDFYLEGVKGPFAGIEKAEPPVSEKNYYLIFSHAFEKCHPGLPEAFWKRITHIKNSSSYGTIVSRYTW